MATQYAIAPLGTFEKGVQVWVTTKSGALYSGNLQYYTPESGGRIILNNLTIYHKIDGVFNTKAITCSKALRVRSIWVCKIERIDTNMPDTLI